MSSITTREIDKLPTVSPRPVEMRVLCLGLSRTATMSMYTALNELGYKSHHMMEVLRNKKDGHLNCWFEALTTKVYGTGKPYSSSDFDKLLANYSALTDAPCVNFADELIAAYPKAKIVLTTRDPDSWVQSVETSLYEILSWRLWPLLRLIDPDDLGMLHDYTQLNLIHWSSGDWKDRTALRDGFESHNAHIRAIVPKENLLEFRPRDGWEPLCKFLDKPVPNEPFPHVNEGGNVANIARIIVIKRLVQLAAWPVGIVIVACLAWRYGWRW